MTLITLGALAYVVSPVLLICGWAQWVRQPRTRSLFASLSLGGLILATASALLSRAGVVFGLAGILRPSSTRWFAPLSALATLAFWMLAATSE